MTLGPLYDTHCHLESPRFAGDLAAVLDRARRVDVRLMLTCGTDEGSSKQAAALAADHRDVLAAVGVHPHEARSSGLASDDPAEAQRALDALAVQAVKCGVVAIGEVGLDYHYDFSPRPTQAIVLQRQLALAAELGKPVILHTREAEAEMRAIVDQAPDTLRGVLHCFLSDQTMADWAVARGFYLGFGGAVTFRNAEQVRAVAARVPLERMLLETDAPYMAPDPHRGKRNEPAHVGLVAERIAQVRGYSPTEIAQRTFANAVHLFGPLPDDG